MSQKETLTVSIDTSLLFDALKDSQVRRILNHLKNNNHEVVVPLTVAGELVMQGIQEGKIKQFYEIIEILKEIDATFLIPNPLLRDCCSCIDDYLEEKGTYGSSKSETKTLRTPEDCGTRLKITTADGIRKIL